MNLQNTEETIYIENGSGNKNYFDNLNETYFDNLDEIYVSDEHNYISDRGIEEVRRSHYKLKDQFGKDIFKFIDGSYMDKLYITVVKKKNSNHLFYLTIEKIVSISCSDCGKKHCSSSSSSYVCRGSYLEKNVELNSIYIGRNIEDVLLKYNRKK